MSLSWHDKVFTSSTPSLSAFRLINRVPGVKIPYLKPEVYSRTGCREKRHLLTVTRTPYRFCYFSLDGDPYWKSCRWDRRSDLWQSEENPSLQVRWGNSGPTWRPPYTFLRKKDVTTRTPSDSRELQLIDQWRDDVGGQSSDVFSRVRTGLLLKWNKKSYICKDWRWVIHWYRGAWVDTVGLCRGLKRFAGDQDLSLFLIFLDL